MNPVIPQPLTLVENQQILRLRLLLARAAQRDSLKWWEDDSLTQAGAFLLERGFVFAPSEAARKVALQTAACRYQGAFEDQTRVLHLFRLDESGAVEHGLREADVMQDDLPADPITDLDTLKRFLAQACGDRSGFTVVAERAEHRLEIRLKDEKTRSNPLRLAQIFAWASLEGKLEYPLFPYLSTLS